MTSTPPPICPCCKGLQLTPEQWDLLSNAARGMDMIQVDFGEQGRQIASMLYAHEDFLPAGEGPQ